jgi:N-acetylglutamate synthase-like GNAT family acetyltransferase
MAEKEEIRELVKSVGLETEHLDLAERFYLKKDENRVLIGCVGIEKRKSNIYLQSLAVDKQRRREGIGHELINTVFDSLEEGEILIGLTLFWNNEFYQKCGFEKLDAEEIKQQDDIAGRTKHKYCTAWGKRKLDKEI